MSSVFVPRTQQNDQSKTDDEKSRKEIRKEAFDYTRDYCRAVGKRMGCHWEEKTTNDKIVRMLFINFEPKEMETYQDKVDQYIMETNEKFMLIKDQLISFNDEVNKYGTKSCVIFVNTHENAMIAEMKRGIIGHLTGYTEEVHDFLKELDEEELKQ